MPAILFWPQCVYQISKSIQKYQNHVELHIDGLVQDCSNFSARIITVFSWAFDMINACHPSDYQFTV